MSHPHAPRRGTLQFWHRVRAEREVARIRQWVDSKETKPLGFLGYKVGMCHVIAVDNHPKSLSKGEEISIPSSIIECPPMKVAAINFYKNSDYGLKLVSTVLSQSLDKELARTIQLPKKNNKKIEDVKEFDDLRLLIYTQPKFTGIGTKKPKITEIALGGKKEDKLKYATEKLGKEITVEEVFNEGVFLDIHAVTKGKGFQGPVKRHGIMMRHHKSEKARRGNIRGPKGAAQMWTVPHSGRMGYNQRTEYNKMLIKLGKNNINPKGGFSRFGLIQNTYALVKGSIPGVSKRVVTLTFGTRLNRRQPKELPTVKEVIT